MATTVYTKEEIELGDGSPVTLKPLNIKNLRKFMEIMSEFGGVESEEEGIEVLIDAAGVCLSVVKPEFWDAEAFRKEVDGQKRFGKHTDEAEEVLDLQTVYKVLDVCGGVKLNDPNLLAAAAESLGTA